jgi:hypothetical protein
MAAHPAPKNSECKNPLVKFSPASIFLGSRRHPPHYLPKGQTINSEYYSYLLVQLKDILKEKCHGKVTKGVLFLHDNAPAHGALATQKILVFQCPDYPLYSPDMAQSDHHLFPGLKKKIVRLPFFVRHGGQCCCGDLVEQTSESFLVVSKS